jgi:DNA-binding transcriptional ArsR family regulator
MDTFGQLAGSPVRPPTAAEMTAVAHPTRLRILRLCHRQPLTNQELAGHLGIAPATTLRHVRILDKAGFLAAQPVRNGQHGSLERPYRSTGLSVRLAWDAAESPELLQRIEIATLHAVRAELIEAGPGAIRDEFRGTLRLKPEVRRELAGRMHALLAEFSSHDDPDGEPLSLLWMMHAVPGARLASAPGTGPGHHAERHLAAGHRGGGHHPRPAAPRRHAR